VSIGDPLLLSGEFFALDWRSEFTLSNVEGLAMTYRRLDEKKQSGLLEEWRRVGGGSVRGPKIGCFFQKSIKSRLMDRRKQGLCESQR
jgi:hypothetical protein